MEMLKLLSNNIVKINIIVMHDFMQESISS